MRVSGNGGTQKFDSKPGSWFEERLASDHPNRLQRSPRHMVVQKVKDHVGSPRWCGLIPPIAQVRTLASAFGLSNGHAVVGGRLRLGGDRTNHCEICCFKSMRTNPGISCDQTKLSNLVLPKLVLMVLDIRFRL